MIQRQPSTDAARTAKLIADYEAAVRLFNWEKAAEHLNGFNDADIDTRLAKLSGTEQAEMRRGATRNPVLGGGGRLVAKIDARNPDAKRIAQLIDEYENARASGDWQKAAERLNAFSNDDINIRLGRLTDAQLTHLRQGATTNPRLGGGGRLARAIDMFRVGRDVVAAQGSAASARNWLNAFQALSPADQETRINLLPNAFDAQTTLRRLFAVLPSAELDGTFRATIRRISELIERRVVREATGQTEAQMAQTQAAFMDAEAMRNAAAAAPAGAPPTPAQVQAAHGRSVAAAGLAPRTTNRWSTLNAAGPAAVAAFQARANAAIASIVARAAARAPELGITAAQIHFVPAIIDGASDVRYAEVASGGGLNVGMDFIDAAMANPDYVLGVVVHELYGHPAFGNDMTQSYSFQLFNQARPLATQALSPAARAAPPTQADTFAYGYHGTEIYAEMREERYRVAAPPGSGVKQGDVPRDDIRDHVHLIKTQFAPSLAKALLRGLYARVRIDPRITPAALVLFESAVNAEFLGQNVLR